jgi:hypothetical protein
MSFDDLTLTDGRNFPGILEQDLQVVLVRVGARPLVFRGLTIGTRIG